MDVKVLDGLVFKNAVRTDYRFSTHPYITEQHRRVYAATDNTVVTKAVHFPTHQHLTAHKSQVLR